MRSKVLGSLAPLPIPVASGERHCLALWGQDAGTVYVRRPGTFCYREGEIHKLAEEFWPFAMLSLQVYSKAPSAEQAEAGQVAMADMAARCRAVAAVPPFAGWQRWADFPKPNLDAKDDGLYLEVWEHALTRTVVVAIRGTEFESWRDWLSNFRWARVTRFLPGFADQYTRLARNFALAFADELERRHPELNVRLFATGHSLGAGLAQHFVYALPGATSEGAPMPAVSAVYAFNSSPVTGWMSVQDKPQRDENVKGLQIYRVFEHGEGLAYLRRAMSYVVSAKAADPAIWEIRFNFSESLDFIGSHSMARLACGLARAAFGPPAANL